MNCVIFRNEGALNGLCMALGVVLFALAILVGERGETTIFNKNYQAYHSIFRKPVLYV